MYRRFGLFFMLLLRHLLEDMEIRLKIELEGFEAMLRELSQKADELFF